MFLNMHSSKINDKETSNLLLSQHNRYLILIGNIILITHIESLMIDRVIGQEEEEEIKGGIVEFYETIYIKTHLHRSLLMV